MFKINNNRGHIFEHPINSGYKRKKKCVLLSLILHIYKSKNRLELILKQLKYRILLLVYCYNIIHLLVISKK